MTTLRKILVVDDDPVVGRSFDRVLANKGYAVITAADGAEALAKIAAEQYDAVYTDIKMPGMDGIAVAENIKGNQPWLPVVIVSGFATADNEARAKAAGVSAVLHKPLSPQMIEDSARAIMRERDRATISGVVAMPIAAPAPETLTTPAVTPVAREVGPAARLGLLLAAPFVGLAYVVAMPFVGLGMLVWVGTKAIFKRA